MFLQPTNPPPQSAVIPNAALAAQIGNTCPASIPAASCIVVTNKDDPDPNALKPVCPDTANCTLRAAVDLANTNAANGTTSQAIGFDLSKFPMSDDGRTIVLTQKQLMITANVIINGPGAKYLTISGNNKDRVFYIPQTMSSLFTVSISNLSIMMGYDGSSGGGVYSRATTTLDKVRIADNNSPRGGGIFNDGTLTITNSTIDHNNLIVPLATILAQGGAIEQEVESASQLTVANSTIYANGLPTTSAGGIQAKMGSVTILNSTIANNAGTNTPYWPAAGAGFNFFGGGTATVTNTIFDSNTDSLSLTGNCLFVGTVTVSSSIQWPSGNTSCGSGATNADPKPATILQYGGGTTPIISLDKNGPAANAGNNTVCQNAPINGLDQRGRKRPSDKCDIGAYQGYSSNPAAWPIIYGYSNIVPPPGLTISYEAVAGLAANIPAETTGGLIGGGYPFDGAEYDVVDFMPLAQRKVPIAKTTTTNAKTVTLNDSFSHNTCGPVADDMIVSYNQFKLPDGTFTRALVPASDVFLNLVHYDEGYATTTTDPKGPQSFVNIEAVLTNDPTNQPTPQNLDADPYGYGLDPGAVSYFSAYDDPKTALNNIETALQAGNSIIALVEINTQGLISASLVSHFVVIKGYGTGPELSTSIISNGNYNPTTTWLEVLNPFNNQLEYYEWTDFETIANGLGNDFAIIAKS